MWLLESLKINLTVHLWMRRGYLVAGFRFGALPRGGT